jgi:hypothetical protein
VACLGHGPVLAVRLIEHYISCRAHLPSHRIKDAIRLRTLGVADEDLDATPISELVDAAELLHESPTAEHMQMVHHRLSPMPSLIGCATGEALHRKLVLQVNCGHHDFLPEFHRHPRLLQKHLRHSHHHLISPLHHVILLRDVRCREVSCDPLISTGGGELGHSEFPAIISP